jgi:hypothetical protein
MRVPSISAPLEPIDVSTGRAGGKTTGMRTVFAIYAVVILAGLVIYAVVGLRHS